MRRFTEKNIARRGFTIVELVSVIAVVAILAAILIPTFASIAKDAEQRELKMKLDTAYTEFAADCGFRDEPIQNMDQYTFVATDAIDFSGATVKINAAGYRWNGIDSNDVTTVAATSIDTSSATAIYGPFNGYYLLGKGMALSWSGSGTSSSPFLIHSYQELRAIAERVARGDSFSGKYFRLEGDISINYSSWLPIGGYSAPTQTASTAFSGIFDGNGYCIALSYGRVNQDNYCLFGYTNNATIKNLQVRGHIDGNANMGGIVGRANNSTVQNCLSDMNIQGDHRVGGIVGYATGSTSIAGCMNKGSVTGFATKDTGYDNAAGGIVGEAEASVSISDCCNNGSVNAYSGAVGGIAGIASGWINNCVNTGAITASTYSAQKLAGATQNSLAGGILGWGKGSATVNGCANQGSINAAYHAAGGIVGADATILNCANLGNVEAAGSVGGIAGVISSTACTVSNVLNTSAVSAKSASNRPVGGIIGHVATSGTFNLTLAANSGAVSYCKGKSISYNGAGMLVGSSNNKITLTDTYLGTEKAVYIGNNAATGTVVGGSAGYTGTPTLQTSNAALATAINSRISAAYGSKDYLAWTMEADCFNDLYVPVLTYKCRLHSASRLQLNTIFVGASTVYLPFIDQSMEGSYDAHYVFVGWWSYDGQPQSGDKVILKDNAEFHAEFKIASSGPIGPIPFE